MGTPFHEVGTLGTGVFVAGLGVLVGGLAVLVGGSGVLVGVGVSVAVADAVGVCVAVGVLVALAVDVGGTNVAVGGTLVAVAVAAIGVGGSDVGVTLGAAGAAGEQAVSSTATPITNELARVNTFASRWDKPTVIALFSMILVMAGIFVTTSILWRSFLLVGSHQLRSKGRGLTARSAIKQKHGRGVESR